MPLEQGAHALELGVRVRQLAAHERYRLWRARAGDHILALRVDQVLAEQPARSVAGVSREYDARGAVPAHVAEHHGDDVDGRPVGDVRRYPLLFAVHYGALAHPAAEHGAHGHLQLRVGAGGERPARVPPAYGLEFGDDAAQGFGVEIAVALGAGALLCRAQDILELFVVDAEHDLAEQLDEPPVRVPREPLVAARPRKALDGPVVEAEVEYGVHHARHRDGRA